MKLVAMDRASENVSNSAQSRYMRDRSEFSLKRNEPLDNAVGIEFRLVRQHIGQPLPQIPQVLAQLFGRQKDSPPWTGNRTVASNPLSIA